jgi:hypothetical protein
MMAQTGDRRTPLGLIHEGAGVSPLDWSAPPPGRVHRISGAGQGATIQLFDLTPCWRFGLKGRGASGWLGAHGFAPPEEINMAAPAPSGDADILRLGTEDVAILSRPDAPSPSLASLRASHAADTSQAKGFDAWRDEGWAWFHICGDDVSSLMAMTCPVDLRDGHFAPHRIAQTRAAQMDCIIFRSDRAGLLGFDLLFDIASSGFMLRSLKELGHS